MLCKSKRCRFEYEKQSFQKLEIMTLSNRSLNRNLSIIHELTKDDLN